MKVKNILEAEEEAKRFLKRVDELRESTKSLTSEHIDQYTYCSKETGAVKRASMDLTRSLSKMRNDTY